MKQVREMIREKAQSTDGQDDVDGAQRLPLADAALDLGDPLGDERVADENDGKRDHEPKNQGQDVVGSHAVSPAARREVLKTRRRVPLAAVVQRATEDQRNRDTQSHHPEGCDHRHVMGGSDADVGEGVQHRDVTIDANAGEKGDAEVDVDVVQSPGDPTSHVPEDPVVSVQVVMNFKRQHANEQGVHQRQVDHVDVGMSRVLCSAGQAVQSHHVFYQPQHEDDAVDDSKQGILEIRVQTGF